MPGAGSAHGFVDDLLSHVSQLAVLSLAHHPQVGECVLSAAPRPSPDEPDRLIDHWSRRQRRLQLDGERQRVGEDLRVVHGDRCFTPELGRRLAALFPDSSMVEVPGARTFVPLDNPGAVVDAIVAVSGARAAN